MKRGLLLLISYLASSDFFAQSKTLLNLDRTGVAIRRYDANPAKYEPRFGGFCVLQWRKTDARLALPGAGGPLAPGTCNFFWRGCSCILGVSETRSRTVSWGAKLSSLPAQAAALAPP